MPMQNQDIKPYRQPARPSTKPIITMDGRKMKPSFDPQLLADFDAVWNKTFHQTWQPVYKEDMKLNTKFDFFKTVVNRVKKFNESYDMTIVGDRGLGKSAFGLGAAYIMHCEYVGDYNAKFPMRQVCFDVDNWIEITQSMDKGGVCILDEVGTEGSLSSRTSMSKGNRATSDLIQLMRTQRIITIYISTDRDRIDKRVRQLTSVMGSPTAKLSNEDTNGYGLALEADIKYRRTVPASDQKVNKGKESDSGYLIHTVSPIQYSKKGRINGVVVPHSPIDMWSAYNDLRQKKLDLVRNKGIKAYNDE